MGFVFLKPEEVVARPDLNCPTYWYHGEEIRNHFPANICNHGWALVTNTHYSWVFNSYTDLLEECIRWENEVSTFYIYRAEQDARWTLWGAFEKKKE